LDLALEPDNNDVPALFTSIVTSNKNNDNSFFFDTTEGNFKMLARPQNNHKLTHTFDFRKMSEIEELKVDENMEHFVFWMDRLKWVTHLPTEIIKLPKNHPNLKSVTFRDNIGREFKHNPVQRFIELRWDCEINVEFGAKGHKGWYAYNKFSEFYIWDSAERELKGIRFDEFILTYPVDEDIIKMGNGYFWLNLKKSNYLCIKNLKIATSHKHEMGEFPRFGVGFKQWCEEDEENDDHCKRVLVSKTTSLTHQTLKNYIFIRPSIDSCNWIRKLLKADEFDLHRKQKEASKDSKDVSKEENKVVKNIDGNKEEIKKSKHDPISTKGRSEAVKRETLSIWLHPNSSFWGEGLKKFNKKNFMTLNIWPYHPDSFNRDILDRVFSCKVTSICAPFKNAKSQEFVDYLADKLEQNTESIFEVVCINESKSDDCKWKGFTNIKKHQREEIAKIIRDRKWDEVVFKKDLFGYLTNVHSFQIR
jgi:hypothetical protein